MKEREGKGREAAQRAVEPATASVQPYLKLFTEPPRGMMGGEMRRGRQAKCKEGFESKWE